MRGRSALSAIALMLGVFAVVAGGPLMLFSGLPALILAVAARRRGEGGTLWTMAVTLSFVSTVIGVAIVCALFIKATTK